MKTSSWSKGARDIAVGTAAGASSALVHGNLSQSWQAISMNVAGNAIGNAISDEIAARQEIPPIDNGFIDISEDIRLSPTDYGMTVGPDAITIGPALRAPGLTGARPAGAFMDGSAGDGAGPTIQWRQGGTSNDGPIIQWAHDVDAELIAHGTSMPIATKQSLADKALYALGHPLEMQAAFDTGIVHGFYEALLPIGTYLGEEAARYSLGQYDQTTLGKVGNFLLDEEFNGAPKTRAFFDAVSGTFDGIVSDLPNAVHEGYDFAKGVATAGGNAFLDWLDVSSAPEIAHGAGKVVGNYAALEGVGKFVEVGTAIGGGLIKASKAVEIGEVSGNVITRTAGKNTVTYTLDAQGNPISAKGTLLEDFGGGRRSYAEASAQTDAAARGVAGDQGGHLVAHTFMPEQGSVNMFPQDANFNSSAFKKLENDYARYLNDGHRVDFEHQLGNFDSLTGRPGTVDVTFTVRNASGNIVDSFSQMFNNSPRQAYLRRVY